MDLTLTEEQELIQDTARDFLEANRAGADARAMTDDPAGYSTELWRQMVELGWPGLAFDETYGGAGSGYLELCLLIEELGRARVPTPFVSTVACCGIAVDRFGTGPQKARWLSAISAGRVLGYVRALPDGRWGATGSDVSISPRDDGFVLDGKAVLTPYAGGADDLLVVAQRDGAAAPTVVLVDAAESGITVEPVEVVGIDRKYTVRFAGVPVPADQVLGTVDDGGAVVDTITAFGAAATCAEMVGGAQGVLDTTVEYTKSREQFGKPIGSFQAVQHHCADMAIDVLGSRFITYEAIWRLANDKDAESEVSVAKSWVSEAYQRVCTLGHQVHGAIGFTEEHDLHYYTRHAISSALAFGDADAHTEHLAKHLGL